MLIDTHTHLYLEEFVEDSAGVVGVEAIDRAVLAGVGMMVLPAVDASSVAPMRSLHAARPDVTRLAIGLHPTEVSSDDVEPQLQYVLDELRQHPDDYVAIGEVGIDLYWDASNRERQMQAFERQLQIAYERTLPVIIHCRNGLDEVLEVIGGLENRPQAVFHSFGGDSNDVERIRRYGDFYFGINGIVTFKNSSLRHTLPAIGIERILLETDAPYLAPVPHRGRRNESAYITATAAHVAQHLGLTNEQVAEATTANARSFF